MSNITLEQFAETNGLSTLQVEDAHTGKQVATVAAGIVLVAGTAAALTVTLFGLVTGFDAEVIMGLWQTVQTFTR